MPGQRAKTRPEVETPRYRYPDMVTCEENEMHHVAKVPYWPPRPAGAQDGNPAHWTIGCRCELCGCWLVVYKAHATGEMAGVRVIMPEKPATEEVTR